MASNTIHAACIKTNSVDSPPLHINNINSRFGLIWLTNTSSDAVDISVKVYDQNGTDVTSSVVSGPSSKNLYGKNSNTFALYGNGETRTVFTEITWTSPDCLHKPIVASLETQWGNSISLQNINSGEPF